jgi:hypothetical protein
VRCVDQLVERRSGRPQGIRLQVLGLFEQLGERSRIDGHGDLLLGMGFTMCSEWRCDRMSEMLRLCNNVISSQRNSPGQARASCVRESIC